MPRARKPAMLKKGKSESKEQLAIRAEAEQRLMGNKNLVKDVPEHLDPLAQAYYLFLVTELEISDLITNLDVPLLEQTADSLSKMRQADEIINDEGLIVEINGMPKEHPAINVKQKYLNQFRALSNQLGLSPSSRAQLAGMQVEKDTNDADPLLQILGGS